VCTCDEEDYQVSDGECAPKEFTLYLNSSVNTIQLEFRKYLLQELEFSQLEYKQSSILQDLSLKFTVIEVKKKYSILFHSKIDLDTKISVTLSLADLVQDRQHQTLSKFDYGVQVPILFENNTQYIPDNTQIMSY
jgi:hypothetical protein